jgi:uncharacterized phage protein gp47/JayE
VIGDGQPSIEIAAVLAGEDGNCDNGTSLSFESPIAGVDSSATVAGDITDGVDEEDIEDYRVRVLDRMSAPPHGGSSADYVAWAKEVAGVTRAWCYPLEDGPGSVYVRFVRDDDSGSIMPDGAEVSEVLDYITARMPVTAVLTVEGPTPVELDFDVDLTPNSSATRAAVTAALEDLLLRTAIPGGSILLSQIELAVGNSEGVLDFAVITPAANVYHDPGEMAVMGDATFGDI